MSNALTCDRCRATVTQDDPVAQTWIELLRVGQPRRLGRGVGGSASSHQSDRLAGGRHFCSLECTQRWLAAQSGHRDGTATSPWTREEGPRLAQREERPDVAASRPEPPISDEQPTPRLSQIIDGAPSHASLLELARGAVSTPGRRTLRDRLRRDPKSD